MHWLIQFQDQDRIDPGSDTKNFLLPSWSDPLLQVSRLALNLQNPVSGLAVHVVS